MLYKHTKGQTRHRGLTTQNDKTNKHWRKERPSRNEQGMDNFTLFSKDFCFFLSSALTDVNGKNPLGFKGNNVRSLLSTLEVLLQIFDQA